MKRCQNLGPPLQKDGPKLEFLNKPFLARAVAPGTETPFPAMQHTEYACRRLPTGAEPRQRKLYLLSSASPNCLPSCWAACRSWSVGCNFTRKPSQGMVRRSAFIRSIRLGTASPLQA